MSRYKLELFLVEGEELTKVKVEKTEFMVGAVLGDPLSRDKAKPGDGNILVLITGSRGRPMENTGHQLISWDRYVRYRLFVELAGETVVAGEVALKDNSLLQRMGRYEVVAEDKLYYPTGGSVVIDSIADKKLFGSIDGRFVNRLDDTIGFEGRFKAKISD